MNPLNRFVVVLALATLVASADTLWAQISIGGRRDSPHQNQSNRNDNEQNQSTGSQSGQGSQSGNRSGSNTPSDQIQQFLQGGQGGQNRQGQSGQGDAIQFQRNQQGQVQSTQQIQNAQRAGQSGVALGTWQGIYLWEHRHHRGERELVVSVLGDQAARSGR